MSKSKKRATPKPPRNFKQVQIARKKAIRQARVERGYPAKRPKD